jgi:hypothetical protein
MTTLALAQSVFSTKARRLTLALGSLCLLLTASNLPAQTFSSLSGTVADTSKASVKSAEVTVTSIGTGAARVTTTSDTGFYSFPDLLAGHYSIRVKAPGFQAELSPDVKLDAAVSATVDFSLHAGDVSQTVDVDAVGVDLDRTSATIADTFTTRQVDNTLVNGRTSTNFALLAPGAVIANQTIISITFNGLGVYDNYFYLDGVDDTFVYEASIANGFARGARLLSGSQETVAEIRTQSNGYQPEYGRAAGGVINFVTRAGTNHFHGEAYDFFRNEALDARNFFARPTPTNLSKPRFRYNDFGGQLSGPIWKDKTFFLANYEGDRQALGFVTQGTVLSSTSRAAALAAHPVLAPIINEEPVGIDSTVNPQLANYYAYDVLHVSENTGSLRIDQNLGSRDSLFARYNFNQGQVTGPLFSVAAPYFGKDASENVPSGITNIAIHAQHIFSPRLLNDALVGLQRTAIILNQATPLPAVSIAPLTIVTGSVGVTSVFANSFQYGDSMSLVVKNHTLKWGGTFFRVQDNQSTANTATITYTSINNFINDSATQVALKAGDPGHGTRNSVISSYIQDVWQARPNLTVSYGLRWDLSTTPHDKNYSTSAYSLSTGALLPVGHEFFPINPANFGPRLGLAYSLTPRTVFRAGAGIYYATFPLSYITGNIYGNTLTGTETLTQASNPGLGYPYTPFTNGTFPIPTLYGFSQPKPDLYSNQYNASLSRELGKGIFAQVAYVGQHAVNLTRLENVNLLMKGTATRPNPTYSDIYVYQGNGLLSYNGMQASLKGKVKTLYADLQYAWAHAIDNLGTTSEPQDYNNIAADRSNDDYDQRQSLKYTLFYDIPVGSGHALGDSSPRALKTAISGWSVNSLGLFTSGVPVNITQANNTYGNGDLINQRPNRVAGQPLYLPRTINAAGGVTFLNPAAWAPPAAGTFGNSPRNPVNAPHLTQVDIALMKTTPIHEDQKIEFRAEFFNLLNHPNFAAPTATYSPTSTTFGTISSTFGTSIGFGTPRQIQFALKYLF